MGSRARPVILGGVGIPDFVSELRRHIGTAPLWLSGATAVIADAERANVLLIRRADNGVWAPVTGIVDPGEHSADTARREALEEAGVEIRVDRLARVGVSAPVTHVNGDRAQYLDHTYECTHLAGDPYPADGECLEARWFAVDDLPSMPDHMADRVAVALSGEDRTRF